MTKFICDDCKKPLDEPPFILVNGLVILSREGPKQPPPLHFCDHKCMNSWVVKESTKPSIISP